MLPEFIYENSPAGIGLTDVMEVSMLFNGEEEAINRIHEELNVSDRRPFKRNTPAVNLAISYVHRQIDLSRKENVRYLLRGLQSAFKEEENRKFRLWYDRIYCIGVDWDTRTSYGWISHALEPYIRYPVMYLAHHRMGQTSGRGWVEMELTHALLGQGMFHGNQSDRNGTFDRLHGEGEHHWNNENGGRHARRVRGLVNDKTVIFGLVEDKRVVLNLLNRYAGYRN